ncbi:MAG: DNA polymerase III subunit delta [Mucinivorans sp.]
MAKLNFKDSLKQTSELVQKMSSGVFGSIYLLMGEEPYFIDKVADYVAAHCLTEDEKAFNQIVIYGKDSSGADVALQAKRYPMMAPRQVVIVREAQMLTGLDMLEAYARHPMKSTVLVLCFKGKSLDKRTTLFKSIDKTGVVLESITPRDYEIESFLVEFLRERGVQAEAKALAMIVQALGANISKIENEIDKLLTRLPLGTKNITATDVEQNIGISKDFNVFELTKALSVRDFRTALLIADHFARNPKDNPLVVTVSLLFTHFQRIVMLNIIKWESTKRGTPMPTESEIASRLKLASSYFVGEYLTASKNYPSARAFAIIGLLRQADCRSKGMGTGSATDGQILRELILRMATV